MNLDEIIKNFAERLTDIDLYQRATKETAKKELLELNKYADQLKKNPLLKELGFSAHAMYFYDPQTGTATPYGYRKSSVEERAFQVILQKNKQYCWLLTEAYEEFEDYLESIYAYVGKADNASWLMSDFGNISLSDLPEKQYDWYLDRAKSKRNIPQSILTRLRSLYPSLVDIETNNKLNVNLKVAIELIANLRHIIVHKSGVVSDREKFLENTLKKSGLWNNGNYHPDYKQFIEKFFGTGEYENSISLLEIRIIPEIPIEINHDLYGELSGYLIAYAVLIYREISGGS